MVGGSDSDKSDRPNGCERKEVVDVPDQPQHPTQTNQSASISTVVETSTKKKAVGNNTEGNQKSGSVTGSCGGLAGNLYHAGSAISPQQPGSTMILGSNIDKSNLPDGVDQKKAFHYGVNQPPSTSATVTGFEGGGVNDCYRTGRGIRPHHSVPWTLPPKNCVMPSATAIVPGFEGGGVNDFYRTGRGIRPYHSVPWTLPPQNCVMPGATNPQPTGFIFKPYMHYGDGCSTLSIGWGNRQISIPEMKSESSNVSSLTGFSCCSFNDFGLLTNKHPFSVSEFVYVKKNWERSRKEC